MISLLVALALGQTPDERIKALEKENAELRSKALVAELERKKDKNPPPKSNSAPVKRVKARSPKPKLTIDDFIQVGGGFNVGAPIAGPRIGGCPGRRR
jgi:hypothetical protein